MSSSVSPSRRSGGAGKRSTSPQRGGVTNGGGDAMANIHAAAATVADNNNTINAKKNSNSTGAATGKPLALSTIHQSSFLSPTLPPIPEGDHNDVSKTGDGSSTCMMLPPINHNSSRGGNSITVAAAAAAAAPPLISSPTAAAPRPSVLEDGSRLLRGESFALEFTSSSSKPKASVDQRRRALLLSSISAASVRRALVEKAAASTSSAHPCRRGGAVVGAVPTMGPPVAESAAAVEGRGSIVMGHVMGGCGSGSFGTESLPTSPQINGPLTAGGFVDAAIGRKRGRSISPPAPPASSSGLSPQITANATGRDAMLLMGSTATFNKVTGVLNSSAIANPEDHYRVLAQLMQQQQQQQQPPKAPHAPCAPSSTQVNTTDPQTAGASLVNTAMTTTTTATSNNDDEPTARSPTRRSGNSTIATLTVTGQKSQRRRDRGDGIGRAVLRRASASPPRPLRMDGDADADAEECDGEGGGDDEIAGVLPLVRTESRPSPITKGFKRMASGGGEGPSSSSSSSSSSDNDAEAADVVSLLPARRSEWRRRGSAALETVVATAAAAMATVASVVGSGDGGGATAAADSAINSSDGEEEEGQKARNRKKSRAEKAQPLHFGSRGGGDVTPSMPPLSEGPAVSDGGAGTSTATAAMAAAIPAAMRRLSRKQILALRRAPTMALRGPYLLPPRDYVGELLLPEVAEEGTGGEEGDGGAGGGRNSNGAAAAAASLIEEGGGSGGGANAMSAAVSSSVPMPMPLCVPPWVVAAHQRLYTIVLDLDETVVYARDGPLFARSHLRELLLCMHAYAEVVVWTAGEREYAKAVLEEINTDHVIQHLIYRHKKWFDEGDYTKDLRLLGRDMRYVLILENTPDCVRVNPMNGIIVEDYEPTHINFIDTAMIGGVSSPAKGQQATGGHQGSGRSPSPPSANMSHQDTIPTAMADNPLSLGSSLSAPPNASGRAASPPPATAPGTRPAPQPQPPLMVTTRHTDHTFRKLITLVTDLGNSGNATVPDFLASYPLLRRQRVFGSNGEQIPIYYLSSRRGRRVMALSTATTNAGAGAAAPAGVVVAADPSVPSGNVNTTNADARGTAAAASSAADLTLAAKGVADGAALSPRPPPQPSPPAPAVSAGCGGAVVPNDGFRLVKGGAGKVVKANRDKRQPSV